jgi:hypothetical protein
MTTKPITNERLLAVEAKLRTVERIAKRLHRSAHWASCNLRFLRFQSFAAYHDVPLPPNFSEGRFRKLWKRTCTLGKRPGPKTAYSKHVEAQRFSEVLSRLSMYDDAADD